MKRAGGASGAGSGNSSMRENPDNIDGDAGPRVVPGPDREDLSSQGGIKRTRSEGNEPTLKRRRLADVDDAQANTMAVLRAQIENNDLEAIKAALQKYSNWVDLELSPARKSKGEHLTPLCLAALHGHVELARLLLAHGAKLEMKSGANQCTPLLLAAKSNKLEIVKLLLARGAKLEASAQQVPDNEATVDDRSFLDDEENEDGTFSPKIEPGDNALHLAVKFKAEDVSDYLLLNKLDLNAANATGQTPLHLACCTGDLALARQLHQRGAKLDIRSVDGKTYLMSAAEYQHDHVVNWLLGLNAAVNDTCGQGRTALVWVLASCPDDAELQRKAVAIVRALLAAGANPNQADNEQYTALMQATRIHHFDVVEILLQHKAEVNLSNRYGMTALSFSVRSQNLGTVKKLVGAGADVNCASQDGQGLLDRAVEGKQPEILKFLLESGLKIRADDSPLAVFGALGMNDLRLLQALHKAGADFSVRDESKMSPLMSACRLGQLETAKWLLEQKADPTAVDEQGWSPLHHACFMGCLELAELMLKVHPDNLNQPEASGETPLILASKQGQAPVVQMLLGRKADVTHQSNNGQALHYACLGGKAKVVRLLLDHGIDPMLPDANQKSALVLGIWSNNVETAELLWNHVKAAGVVPGSLLFNAAETDAGLVFEWLLSMPGVDVHAPTDGYNVLDIALNNGSHGLVERLLLDGHQPTRLINLADTYSVDDLGTDLMTGWYQLARHAPIIASAFVPEKIRVDPLTCFQALAQARELSISDAMRWYRPDFLALVMRPIYALLLEDEQAGKQLVQASMRLDEDNDPDYKLLHSLAPGTPQPDATSSPAQNQQWLAWMLKNLDSLSAVTKSRGIEIIHRSKVSQTLKDVLKAVYRAQNDVLKDVGEAGLKEMREKWSRDLRKSILNSTSEQGDLQGTELHVNFTRDFGMHRPVANLLLAIAHCANEQARAEGGQGGAALAKTHGERFITAFTETLAKLEPGVLSFAFDNPPATGDDRFGTLLYDCLRDQWTEVCSALNVKPKENIVWLNDLVAVHQPFEMPSTKASPVEEQTT